MIYTDPPPPVAMPAYNERTTIAEIVRRVLAVPSCIKLIVADEGSMGGAGGILHGLRQKIG